VYVFTLTDDAQLVVAAVAGAIAVSAEGGEGSIVLVGQPTGSLMYPCMDGVFAYFKPSLSALLQG